MADTAPRFVLVMSVSPHNNGNFGRAGLRFTREWRALEVAAVLDLEKGVIDDAILQRLKAESFLAVKDATPEEVARLAEQRADASKDKNTELAELRSQNAELEARLMRIEVGTAQAGAGADRATAALEAELAELRSQNAELEARLASLPALEARLLKLETSRAAEPPSAPTPPATVAAPADKKTGKS